MANNLSFGAADKQQIDRVMEQLKECREAERNSFFANF